MPVDYASKIQQYKVPNLPEAGANVFFGDVLGNKSLTGSWFLLEGPSDSTPPKYPYDESGILIEGELSIKDETGKKINLQPGDTFFVHNGSEITFSTPKFALAYKTSNRPVSKL
ncbi:uncharacterized protein A1O5_04993 [Cladophialophora psammophila CBS 110553]|uniref:(S)-ureidoglycine aminohydrolase cupin domain-containing protein n=1 Tax=Cladophialophora psammophila CBS 110553 TaxID=1182543 RepID=W9WX29_9EURO|nr:uncharacterized protein A1O5_04993 [Cladophialophora psammophila CBS 110553]EXJ72488.1 hypothetical protein A1O5_04993 [Cladophialophora psammophila CBS 110553]